MGSESPPSTCWPLFFDAAQDAVGHLGCKHTLPGHAELLVNQHPQVLLLRATEQAMSDDVRWDLSERDCIGVTDASFNGCNSAST